MRLEYKQGTGWVLHAIKEPNQCEACFKEMTLPFMWCRQFEKAFCRRCEIEKEERLCMSKQMEHEHFKIVRVEVPQEIINKEADNYFTSVENQ